MLRRLLLAAAIASTAVCALGGVARAHIDPDPTQAQAGSRVTVGFTVEHGCDRSPTTQFDMRLPDGVVDAVAEPVDDWDATVEIVGGDTIVTFAGGPLADDVEGTFEVTMTLPPTPDVTIHFPFVQRCEMGEIRWIGIPAEPGDVLDEPAPAMQLVGPVVNTPNTSTAPAGTEPAGTEPAATDAPTTTTAAAEIADTVPAGTDEAAGSGTGTVVFIASMAVVLALFGFVLYRSRQARANAGRNGD
jgi:uncharacterized protein YcnI